MFKDSYFTKADSCLFMLKAEPYKKLGVYDIACELRDIASVKKEIEERQKEIAKRDNKNLFLKRLFVEI